MMKAVPHSAKPKTPHKPSAPSPDPVPTPAPAAPEPPSAPAPPDPLAAVREGAKPLSDKIKALFLASHISEEAMKALLQETVQLLDQLGG